MNGNKPDKRLRGRERQRQGAGEVKLVVMEGKGKSGSAYRVIVQDGSEAPEVMGVPDGVQLVDGGEKKGGLVSTIIKLPVE